MSENPSRAIAPEQLAGLELMRFACALSVLVWHYKHFYFVGSVPTGFVADAQPAFALLRPLYEAGWLGVQLFWALSGFIFFWKYGQSVAERRVSAGRFAWLRFSRLYPLHLVTLVLVAALALAYRAQTGGADFVYTHNTPGQFALHLLMASEWAGRGDWSFNGPIWSVSIEVLVYALFFAGCLAGGVGLKALVAVVVVMAAVYAAKLTSHPVVLCLFFFYLGGLTHRTAVWALAQPRRLSIVLWGGAAALAAATALTARGSLRPMFYVALLGPVAMLWLVCRVSLNGQRLKAWASGLGNTTYASYLLHFPLQLAVMVAVGGDPGRLPLASPWWLLAYLVVTFALAFATFSFVEKPAQAALRRWRAR